MIKLWNRLFLEERPSIGLSFFRIVVALTVGFHVIPSFFHLEDTFFHTAFKTANGLFFPYDHEIGFVEGIQLYMLRYPVVSWMASPSDIQ